MDHREAKMLLVDLVAGDLNQASRNAVTSHVEECVACRAWLEAHDLLASLSAMDTNLDHLDSEFLALCVVQPEVQDQPGNSDDLQHLESCVSCGSEMELVREAVEEARADGAGSNRAIRPGKSRSWWYVAAAACGVAIALRFFFPTESANRRSVDPEQRTAVASVDESLQPSPVSLEKTISEEEISGTRLIEGDGSLMLSRVKIE